MAEPCHVRAHASAFDLEPCAVGINRGQLRIGEARQHDAQSCEEHQVPNEDSADEPEQGRGDQYLSRACSPEHHKCEGDQRIDGEDISAPDERPMHDTDGKQRSGPPVIRIAQIRLETVRTQELNTEADTEQQDQQGIKAAFQQPFLRPPQCVIECRNRLMLRVPVVQVRPEHAEHRPSAQQVERVDAFLWSNRSQGGSHVLNMRGYPRRWLAPARSSPAPRAPLVAAIATMLYRRHQYRNAYCSFTSSSFDSKPSRRANESGSRVSRLWLYTTNRSPRGEKVQRNRVLLPTELD